MFEFLVFYDDVYIDLMYDDVFVSLLIVVCELVGAVLFVDVMLLC